MKAKHLRVTVMYKDGSNSTFEGVIRIFPSFDGSKIFLMKDLTEEEMKIYNKDPNEDEDFMTCTIENAMEVNLFVSVM